MWISSFDENFVKMHEFTDFEKEIYLAGHDNHDTMYDSEEGMLRMEFRRSFGGKRKLGTWILISYFYIYFVMKRKKGMELANLEISLL